MSPETSFVVPGVQGRGRSAFALTMESLRRPGGRRGLSALAGLLLLAGVALFAYPLATNVYQGYLQHDLKTTFASGDSKIATEYKAESVPTGDGLTELTIKSIGVDVLVVQGTTPSALRAGAGHYTDTPLPGQPGNVGIAGHRTTFGRPFNRLDEVTPGDLAQLKTPFGTYTYQAVANANFDGQNPHPVDPVTGVTVLDQPAAAGATTNQHLLTLTTCNPKGSAAQRLVLRLTLVKAVPLPGKTIPADTMAGAVGMVSVTSGVGSVIGGN